MSKRKRSAANLGFATFEQLEDRRLFSATLSVAQSLLAFNAVKNSSASPVETLTLTNTGNAPLALGSSGLSVVNDPTNPTADAARFSIVNQASAPATLAAGQSFALQLQYSANTVGLNSAFLDIATNDPNNPLQQVALRGIGTAGLGGTNQPSLMRILQAYEIPTLVGETNISNALYPNPPAANSQEVTMQDMVKAGTGPVTIQVLASFTSAATTPYTLGYYTTGTPDDKTQLFTTLSNEYQSVYVQPQGTTTFDPGSSTFGMYFVSNILDNGTNRIGYTEDGLNTFDTTNSRKFRFFPLENSNGTVVPNAYVMTTTEWNSPGGYDFTNMVAIIRNVQAAPTAPTITVQNPYALPGSDNVIFNRIDFQNTTVGDTVHDTNPLVVTNTGASPLTISSYTLSTGWTLVNPPAFPLTLASGQQLTLTVKFIDSTLPSHSYNETNTSLYPNGGAVLDGQLVLNSNDPVTPARTMQLRGWYQYHSENNNEPSLQSILNLLAGWQTNINSTPIPGLDEGTTPTYYGDEVVSAYWNAADTNLPVSIEQIDGFHTQGNTAATSWYSLGSNTMHALFTTYFDDGQTLFPSTTSTGGVAAATFSPTGSFGFRIDTEYSDDSKNAIKTGGGHHVRFFPVIDDNGNLVANTYIMAMDYGVASGENFDFQDNVYLVRNITPAKTPPTPADLSATTASNGVLLQWQPVTDSLLKGYNVYTSLSPSTGFTLLTSTPITAATYLDTSAPAGSTLYYKVTAVDTNGESMGLIQSVVTPGAATNGTLTSTDIGATTPGTTTVVTPGSAFTVVAGGPGISGTADGFRYIYQQQTGDFDVEMQVDSLTVSGNYSTAGIMARSTLATNSPNVYTSASPVNYRFKYRATPGAQESITVGSNLKMPNVWLRLSRVGNVFTSYTSTNGTAWTKSGTVTLALPSTLYLGVAVASNVVTGTTTAQITNYGTTVPAVPVTPVVPVVVAPPAPSGFLAAGITGGVSLTWTPLSYANLKGYNIYSSTSVNGTYTLLTPTPITTTSYVDTSTAAASGQTMYYELTAVDATSNLESTPATTSGAAIIPPPVVVPPPVVNLTSVDIGASIAGSTTVVTAGSAYDVTAGGPGVTGNSDGFRFLYTQQTGNFDVKVQVNSLTVAGNFATAGIMARATLDADSPEAYMSASPVNYRFKYRNAVNTPTGITAAGTATSPNVWVRLTRVGNVFTGYMSSNGTTWTEVSSVTMTMPTTMYLGLAVASNDTTDTTTADMSNYGNT